MDDHFIRAIQEELNSHGYELRTDGQLGPKTYQAILNAIGQGAPPAGAAGAETSSPLPPPTLPLQMGEWEPDRMPMRTSADGIAHIEQREGVRLKAYRDSKGIWTIGTGHTAAAGDPKPRPGMVITMAQNDEILRRDLADVEHAINAYVTAPLEQHEFDALASIVLNIGVPKLITSTFLKRINKRSSKASIAEAILMWNKPKEIIGRRKGEAAQFLGQ